MSFIESHLSNKPKQCIQKVQTIRFSRLCHYTSCNYRQNIQSVELSVLVQPSSVLDCNRYNEFYLFIYLLMSSF